MSQSGIGSSSNASGSISKGSKIQQRGNNAYVKQPSIHRSGIRNKLESDYLCPALRATSSILPPVTAKSADHEGRAAIRVDGVEVLRSNYYTYFENVWTKFHHLRSTTLKDHNSAREAIDRAYAYALEQGTFDQKVFYEAFAIFDNQSIEKKPCQ